MESSGLNDKNMCTVMMMCQHELLIIAHYLVIIGICERLFGLFIQTMVLQFKLICMQNMLTYSTYMCSFQLKQHLARVLAYVWAVFVVE